MQFANVIYFELEFVFVGGAGDWLKENFPFLLLFYDNKDDIFLFGN